MRAIMDLAREPGSVMSSSTRWMRATRKEERRSTPARRGTPDSMRRRALGLVGNFPQGGHASRVMSASKQVEDGPNVGMRASWKSMSAPFEILSASVKLRSQVVKLSRRIVSDVRGRVSDYNAVWNSPTAL